MIKKLIVLGAVGFVAVSAVKGSKWGSYIRSEINDLRSCAEAAVPPEREVARLRNEIKLLDKDVLGVVNQLARERVAVKELREKADELRAAQARDKELLEARAAAIKASAENQPVSFGGRRLTVAAATAELDAGVRRFTANEKSLAGLDAALASREQVRGGLERQLDVLKNQKAELAATVDALEAELTALKLQQMESRYQTDDTRLARIKEDIRAMRTKLEVEREKLKLMPAALEPAGAKAAGGRSVDEIMAPLSAKPAQAPVAD
jgi:predicted  nucleic acid-binding Zn-ribbon protein